MGSHTSPYDFSIVAVSLVTKYWYSHLFPDQTAFYVKKWGNLCTVPAVSLALTCMSWSDVIVSVVDVSSVFTLHYSSSHFAIQGDLEYIIYGTVPLEQPRLKCLAQGHNGDRIPVIHEWELGLVNFIKAYWGKTVAHNFPKPLRFFQCFERQKAYAGFVISQLIKKK